MTNNILTLLSTAAPLALILALWVMAQISRRFGEVTHRPPLYRWFYVSLGLAVFPLAVRALAVAAEEPDSSLAGDSVVALIHNLPLALSLTLAVGVAWRYWGWLVYAGQDQVAPTSRPKP